MLIYDFTISNHLVCLEKTATYFGSSRRINNLSKNVARSLRGLIVQARKILITQPIDGVKVIILHIAYNSDSFLVHIKLSDKICFFSNPQDDEEWGNLSRKSNVEI